MRLSRKLYVMFLFCTVSYLLVGCVSTRELTFPSPAQKLQWKSTFAINANGLISSSDTNREQHAASLTRLNTRIDFTQIIESTLFLIHSLSIIYTATHLDVIILKFISKWYVSTVIIQSTTIYLFISQALLFPGNI